MSTLKVNSIGKTSGSTQDTMEGLAKAWSLFDQTGTTEIKESFNCSSVTDHSTGETGHTLTNNMSNGNYCNPASSGEQTGGGNRSMGINGNRGQASSSTTNIMNSLLTNSRSDDDRINIAWLGDLA